jgi:hypothetical protein
MTIHIIPPRPIEGQDTIERRTIVVSNADLSMMRAIERFILGYHGDDLLHDIELTFPGASYRAFYLAQQRVKNAARWFEPEGRS